MVCLCGPDPLQDISPERETIVREIFVLGLRVVPVPVGIISKQVKLVGPLLVEFLLETDVCVVLVPLTGREIAVGNITVKPGG